MMLVSIAARAIDCGFQNQKLQTSRVASPMSRFPRFRDQRSSWMWPTKKAFVRVEADDGSIGWSCTNGGEVVEMIINQHLARILQGESLDDLPALWDHMFCSLLPSDRSGFSMMALAGVDIALWDLKAKAAGESLLTSLGGSEASTLPAYVTTPRPEDHANRGWFGIKAAAPYGPEAGASGLKGNLDYLRRFRDAAGPDAPIMVDAFMAWDADYTLRFLDAAEELSIYWIEDPLPMYDLDGIRRVRAELGGRTQLALGNFAFNQWDCGEYLREQLVDILQPDVAWAGGITEALRIFDLAATADVPIILHNTCEQPWALSLAAARQTDAVVEFVDRGEMSQLYGLMGQRTEIVSGSVTVPKGIEGNRPPPDIQRHFATNTPSGARPV